MESLREPSSKKGSRTSVSKDLCKRKSEAAEIAKGCVLMERWRVDARLKVKEGYSVAGTGVSSKQLRKLSALLDARTWGTLLCSIALENGSVSVCLVETWAS
jgi:hypothetical protein